MAVWVMRFQPGRNENEISTHFSCAISFPFALTGFKSHDPNSPISILHEQNYLGFGVLRD